MRTGSRPARPPAARLSFLSEAASAELLEYVRAVATSIASRPTHVSQRTVETTCSLPKRDYLAAARAGAFPSSKIGRLVLARTEDVAAWIDTNRRAIHALHAPEDELEDEEARCLAEVGARRIR